MADTKAPGDLELVQDFVNTVDLEDGSDQVGSPAALAVWLTERSLLPPGEGLDDDAVGLAATAREALRDLMGGNDGEDVPTSSIDTLNRIGRRASLSVRFLAHDDAEVSPTCGGIDGAVGRLLAIVQKSMADGSWGRLKSCRRDSCRWAFYDESRNHSRAWCSMETCGNREKAKNFRARSVATKS